MTRLLEVIEKLSEADREKVVGLAELLLARQSANLSANASAGGTRKIRFDRWAGCLSHIDPSKADKELIRAAWDEIAAKHDR